MLKPYGDSGPEPAALVLAPEAPYPAAGGGALRTASLVEYLGRRCALDLIVFHEPNAPDPRAAAPVGLARRIDVIELAFHSRSAPARAARNLARFARGVPPLNDRFAGYGAVIERLLAVRSYDLALIEHFWCAPYFEQLRVVSPRVVLDLHNIESTLLERSAKVAGWPVRVALERFARIAVGLERRWLPRFAQVLAASAEDAGRLRAVAPATPILVYPNTIPARSAPAGEKDNAIVFSGNFEYEPNRVAVEFFARQVWPRLRRRRPDLVWRLVGKHAWSVREVVGEDPRVELIGPVEDAVAELSRALIAVAPILSGSGTRVKILEAWAAALPVVSTTLGAEGLEARDGEHLLLADSAADFERAVDALLASPSRREQLGLAGRRLYEERYTWEAAWRRLDEAGFAPGMVK